MKTLYISGYRSYELGIFQANDLKIAIIKNSLTMMLRQLIEEGLEWILIGGNLGVELWAAQSVLELKEEYPELKLGLVLPYADFGNQWKEQNKILLNQIKSTADYCNMTSKRPYENPTQLRNHTKFMLEHTGGLLVVYDEEFLGKTKYLLEEAKKFSEKKEYEIFQITMDDLQNMTFDS